MCVLNMKTNEEYEYGKVLMHQYVKTEKLRMCHDNSYKKI